MTKKLKAEFIAHKLRSGQEIREAYSLTYGDWGALNRDSKRCQKFLPTEDIVAAGLTNTIVACELDKGHTGFHVDGCCRTNRSDCVVVWLEDIILVRE